MQTALAGQNRHVQMAVFVFYTVKRACQLTGSFIIPIDFSASLALT